MFAEMLKAVERIERLIRTAVCEALARMYPTSLCDFFPIHVFFLSLLFLLFHPFCVCEVEKLNTHRINIRVFLHMFVLLRCECDWPSFNITEKCLNKRKSSYISFACVFVDALMTCSAKRIFSY